MTTQLKTIRFPTNTASSIAFESSDDQIILCETSIGNILGAFPGFKGMQHDLTSNGNSTFSATESWTRLLVQPDELVQTTSYQDYFVDPQNRYVGLRLPNVSSPLLYLGACTEPRTLFVELAGSASQNITLMTTAQTASTSLSPNLVMVASCSNTGGLTQSISPRLTLAADSSVGQNNAFYENSTLTVIPIAANVSEFYYMSTSTNTEMKVQFTINGLTRKVTDANKLANDYNFQRNVWYKVTVATSVNVLPLSERHVIGETEMSSFNGYRRYNLLEKIIYDFPAVTETVRLKNTGSFTKPVRFTTRSTSSLSLLVEAVSSTATELSRINMLDIKNTDKPSILSIFQPPPVVNTNLTDSAVTSVTRLDWSLAPVDTQTTVQDGINDFLTIDLGVITTTKRIEFTSPLARSILVQAIIGNVRRVFYRKIFASSSYVINASPTGSLTVTGAIVPDVVALSVPVPAVSFNTRSLSYTSINALVASGNLTATWSTVPISSMTPATVTLCSFPSLAPLPGFTQSLSSVAAGQVTASVNFTFSNYRDLIPPGGKIVARITIGNSTAITNALEFPGQTLAIDVVTNKAAGSGIKVNITSSPMNARKVVRFLGQFASQVTTTESELNVASQKLVPGNQYSIFVNHMAPTGRGIREPSDLTADFTYSAVFNSLSNEQPGVPVLTITNTNTLRAAWDIRPRNAWVTVQFMDSQSNPLLTLATKEPYADYVGLLDGGSYTVSVQPYGSSVKRTSATLQYVDPLTTNNLLYSSRTMAVQFLINSFLKTDDVTRPKGYIAIQPDGYAKVKTVMPASPVTISLWLKFKTVPPSLVTVLSSTDTTGTFLATISTDGYTIACNLGRDGSSIIDIATVGINLADWNHITITSDGVKMRTYMNAVLVDTQPGPVMIGVDNSNIFLGTTDPDSELCPTDMYIDDLRIYSRELLGTEIKDVFLNVA